MFFAILFLLSMLPSFRFFFFFFNDTATTEIYTLSLHDALPILLKQYEGWALSLRGQYGHDVVQFLEDRKSTRLNSSHQIISYAVFCLKKKKEKLKPCSQRLHAAATQYEDL